LISIAIAVKNAHDRNTISALLSEQDDFLVTDVGKDGYDALLSATTRQPDIIIMDFKMEDASSQELAPVIKRRSPSTRLIIICSPEDHYTMDNALKTGISGCLLKQDISGQLVSSVRSVFYGGLYMSRPMETQTTTNKKEASQVHNLIPRRLFTNTELQILYGIICGYSDKEIAKSLNMSSGSLRNCINHAKKKTGLHNRTQISAYALLAGIINVEKIRDLLKLIDT